ncbi:MAG: hypothetical protein ACOX15_02835 [Tepidanaerobacteraceae bacterium]
MPSLAGLNTRISTVGVQGATYEEENCSDWNKQSSVIRCPICRQSFLMYYMYYKDNFGTYKMVYGFCTKCEHKIESLINIC